MTKIPNISWAKYAVMATISFIIPQMGFAYNELRGLVEYGIKFNAAGEKGLISELSELPNGSLWVDFGAGYGRAIYSPGS